MKLRHMINNIFCTFTVLSLVFGVLCKAEVLVNLPYTEVLFPLLWMSVGTSAWIALREAFLPDAQGAKYPVEIVGCTAIILLSVRAAGWLELRLPYLLMIFAMVLVVYLCVWFLTWLQSKHDEEDLNSLLKRQKGEKSDGEQ